MTIEPKTYASEAGHWYFPDGTPCHFVEYSDKKRKGQTRPTNLTDARKIGLYPSVSGILKIQAQPGLAYWVKEQVAKAACEMNWFTLDGEDISGVVPLILHRAEENMSKAKDLGSEIHGAIERYLKKEMVCDDVQDRFYLHIKAAVDALKELGVWGQPFRVERSFASDLGYGGCIDLTDGESWIVDFKCVDSLEKKLDYMDRCAQLTAYGVGVCKEWGPQRLCNIFISTSEPGEYLIREWNIEEKVRGWQTFIDCFRLWKTVNQYNPLSIAVKAAP